MNKYIVRPVHLFRRQKIFQAYFDRCEAQKKAPGLHVGCGDRPISGWCNIDVAHLNHDVQYVDAMKPLPFQDHSFQYVFSEHFIEHLPYEAGMAFFREAYRVLKPGGILRTATPNLDFLNELLRSSGGVHQRYVDWTVDKFAPHLPKSPVASINLIFYGWGHQFIYNPAFLEQSLRPMGFSEFKSYRPGESEESALKTLEQHGKSVPPEINEMETFVLEARKP